MRTTVTIDDDLLAEVKVFAARRHRTIGSVLEEALKKMLSETEREPRVVELPDFAYAGGLRADVDLYDKETMARLLGEASR